MSDFAERTTTPYRYSRMRSAWISTIPDMTGSGFRFPTRTWIPSIQVTCWNTSSITGLRSAIGNRVLKSGGFIVCIVPHQFLYEKKTALPSIWNSDHKRFYTPASLLREFEEALVPNTYRIRHLCDSDDGYTYDIGPDVHSGGGYEIELVVQKIKKTVWVLAGSPNDGAAADLDEFSRLIAERDKWSRESD